MRQEERRARTRGVLLQAAVSGFAENGYDGVSLDAIATGAGLSKGAIYAHFETKLDLYAAVVDGVLGAAHVRNRLVSAALADGQPAAAAAQAYFGAPASQHHVALVTDVWQMATREARVRVALEEFRERRRAEFSGAAVSAGARPAFALDLALTVGKLIDADTLYGRLGSGDALRAG